MEAPTKGTGKLRDSTIDCTRVKDFIRAHDRILLLLWDACQSSARTNLPANLETVCNWIGESDNVIMVREQTRILSQCCEINERLLAFDGSGVFCLLHSTCRLSLAA
jgi:hypothetical protein